MQDLRARLINGGFPDVSFRIIISKVHNKNETGGVDILRSFAGDIPVIEESEKIHPTWQSILEGEIDHILVLDRCGRLAFQVISPWSLLSYPYVKASILSTYNDDPCGPCNATKIKVEASYITIPVDNSTFTGTNSDSSEIQTTPETTEEQIDEDYNLTDVVPSTIPLSPNSQTETTIVEEDNDRETVEMEQSSTNKTAESSFPNIQNTDLSSSENLQSITSHMNIVIREKIKPESPASLVTEQPMHNVYKDDMMEPDNIMDENELDATLSPLAERKDGSVPIRVIMRFPHKHVKNGTDTEYEYLVLQTGNPEYHGHLESEENRDLVPPEDKGHKKHLSEHGKKHKGKKHHSSRKPVESVHTDDIDEPAEEDKSIENHKHKGNKHHKKIKHRESEEIKVESNEEKSAEIKKNKGQIKRPETEEDQESEEKTMEIKKYRGKKIYNKMNVAESEETEETKEEKSEEESEEKTENNTPQQYSSIPPDTQESREISSTENEGKEDKPKGYDNSEITNSNEDCSSSEISQDIRKHGKHHHHHSENNTHNFNVIKHIQKPDRHHNRHKIMVPVNTDVNGTDTKDHIRKIKINKKIHIGINTNDTEGNVVISKDIVTPVHRSENGSGQVIKKTEVHKKKPHNKKHRVSVLEDSVTTTPVPLPIVLYNANKVNDSKPNQVIQNTMKGKLKPVFKNAYNTHGNENRLEEKEDDDDNDDDNMQRLEQVDVITNLGKPNARNKTQEDTLSEENDSEGRDENIIKHYSKLLKWIEYQL